MSVPEHLWRFPTRAAIDSLASRFGFANTPEMQDWEWEVADPNRIDEFLSAYESGELDDDERFTLMETMIQSFEDFDGPIEDDQRWIRIIKILDKEIELHAYSVWYWSDIDDDDLDIEEEWKVSRFLRKILEKHKKELCQPGRAHNSGGSAHRRQPKESSL